MRLVRLLKDDDPAHGRGIRKELVGGRDQLSGPTVTMGTVTADHQNVMFPVPGP